MTNKIFQDPTTTIPKNDPQFVRVPFDGSQIAGRQDFIPRGQQPEASIQHVSTKGSK